MTVERRPEAAPARTSIRRRGPATKRVSVTIAWMVVAGALSTVLSVVTATPAQALSPVLLADWEMNEPPGAQVMVDSSGNGINGAIGSAVQTGSLVSGATAYSWDHLDSNAPPPKPERLVQVNNSRLNPGSRDYAVTVRFRTTHSYGNIIQKGQSQTPGGYFKWEIPKGILMCLFRSRDQNGNLLGQKSVLSPASMPLNDGVWHTVRCEKTVDRVTMTIDGTTTVQSSRGTIGSISNNSPLTIAGKLDCDQVDTTCDYFAGDIDYVHIEAGKSGTDFTPPTTPGKPTGMSNGYTTTDLTWPGSMDNVSTTIQYRIYRDGALVTTMASSASTLNYQVTGLTPGSTHTYSIIATDLNGNSSPMGPVSAPIQVQVAPLGTFVDDFSSGFAKWTTITGMTIDGSTGHPNAPSARVQVTNQAANAAAILSTTLNSACASIHINATSLVANSILMRLRTASDGNIIRVFVDTAGTLRLRSDVSSTQSAATVPLGTGAWHTVELCGTVGTAGTWDLYRDGTRILNQWVANTGTARIGRIELGDFNARTWTASYDTVIVDQAVGEQSPVQDTTPPTRPGQPTGTSPSAGRIALTWAASTDQSTPITYRIYRDGGVNPIGQTTSTTFDDTGLQPGSIHSYAVDAVDPAGNDSQLSPPSDPITVIATPPVIVADDFSTGNFANWTGVTRLTIDATQGSNAAPSARAQVSGQSAWAFRSLGATYASACMSVNVNVSSLGGSTLDLFRLRTASDGPISRALVNTSGLLVFRSDVSGIQQSSGVALGNGWHNIELCGDVGASGAWNLYRDGVRILNGWVANTGTIPIGRIQIGDTAAKTFTANWDDVVLDLAAG